MVVSAAVSSHHGISVGYHGVSGDEVVEALGVFVQQVSTSALLTSTDAFMGSSDFDQVFDLVEYRDNVDGP